MNRIERQTIEAMTEGAKLAYTYGEAAAATGLSRRTLQRKVKAGALRASRVCGRAVITREALMQFLRGGECRPEESTERQAPRTS